MEKTSTCWDAFQRKLSECTITMYTTLKPSIHYARSMASILFKGFYLKIRVQCGFKNRGSSIPFPWQVRPKLDSYCPWVDRTSHFPGLDGTYNAFGVVSCIKRSLALIMSLFVLVMISSIFIILNKINAVLIFILLRVYKQHDNVKIKKTFPLY